MFCCVFPFSAVSAARGGELPHPDQVIIETSMSRKDLGQVKRHSDSTSALRLSSHTRQQSPRPQRVLLIVLISITIPPALVTIPEINSTEVL